MQSETLEVLTSAIAAPIEQAGAALADLAQKPTPPRWNSLLSEIVRQHYEKITKLRDLDFTWDAIGKQLQQNGIAFTSEALRRAVRRHEMRLFGKSPSTGGVDVRHRRGKMTGAAARGRAESTP